MLASSGGELPAATKFVIDLSHGLIGNFVPILIGVGAAIYGFRVYAKSTEGRAVIQNFALKLPIAGNLIIQSGVARFSRTISTLLQSGVPLVDALEICKGASTHVAFEDAIGLMKREVELGASFSNAMLRQQALFPKMALQMAVVGENTGNLDKMMERVAEFYEEEVEVSIQGMLKLIEPVMLVVMGGLVGGLMIAMYLPVFQMAGSVQ
jgi:type IV pilus assembly protein PilC